MARRARWIRLEPVDADGFHAVCAGFSGSQQRAAPPVVLWTCAESAIDGLAPEDEREYLFAIVAPATVAPGCASRWLAWALSPVVAAYRDFGLRAYFNGADICLHGRRIGSGKAEPVGDFVLIVARVQASFDGNTQRDSARGSDPEFRAWLRDGLGLATTLWRNDGASVTERAFEAVLRARIEAQHGWQFDNSWPNAAESPAAAGCAAGLAATPR
jgi:hypothetical protein